MTVRPARANWECQLCSNQIGDGGDIEWPFGMHESAGADDLKSLGFVIAEPRTMAIAIVVAFNTLSTYIGETTMALVLVVIYCGLLGGVAAYLLTD